jgi:CMP/dCMP kinase
MIVAIDGPSGTGKSTVARGLADALGFAYFDTGAMYRALTYNCLKRNISLDDEATLQSLLDEFDFRIEEGRYFVGDEEVTEQLRTPEVTSHVPIVAAIKQVRTAMVQIQRRFATHGDCVFEGRDMGTVVFPQAEAKIFLTARPEVRARRRHLEWSARHPDLDEAQVLADQERRDKIDSSREHSPLRPAGDAIQFDTSDLTADEVISQLLTIVEGRK